MSENLLDLRQQLSQRSDDELMAMLTINPSDYRREALNLASEEILRRRVAAGLPVNEAFMRTIESHQDSASYLAAVRSSHSKGEIGAIITGIIALSSLARFVTSDLVDRVKQSFPIVPIAVIVGLLILPLGMILFFVRQRNLLLYARMEIVFGVFTGMATAWDKIGQEGFQNAGAVGLPTWMALGGALYIVVRGLDNRRSAIAHRHEAWKQKEQIKTLEDTAKAEAENARHTGEVTKLIEAMRSSTQATGFGSFNEHDAA
jgi:hypothetical protein